VFFNQQAQCAIQANSRYASLLEKAGAGAVIVHPDMVDRVPSSATPIVTTAAYEGWARVAALFHPSAPPSPGIHPTAFVAPGVVVDPTVEIGAFACIEGACRLGRDAGKRFT
jgi:UDP-3-O-[3-hydroxymyristoyl] glucosamine N-acyltransferase